MYFKVCTICGAHLDPGERCDCETKEKAASSGANTESSNAKNDNAILASEGVKIND